MNGKRKGKRLPDREREYTHINDTSRDLFHSFDMCMNKFSISFARIVTVVIT